MKKISTIAISVLSFHCAMAQNVGVGTATPAMPLHVRTASDTAVVLVENSTTLASNINTGLYFKTGGYYSGAIKTTGTGSNTSRLGLFSYAAGAQNNMKEYLSISDNGKTGVGTIDPLMLLHVKTATDSTALLLENGAPMATGTNVGLYFKNGNSYSGAIKTIATSNNTARLGLFSYADSYTSSLREYMSVLDNGHVGIGTTTPNEDLTVNGVGSFTNPNAGANVPALNVSSVVTTSGTPAIKGIGAWAGVTGGSANNIGINGYSGSSSYSVPGVGVLGQSSNGAGVYGYSTRSGSNSVQGYAAASDITAGFFQNSLGKALVTSGAVQITGQGAANGRVLTSDASGNATWQAIPTPAGVAFSAYKTSDGALTTTGAALTLAGFTSQYNDGNGFNTTTGVFTAPVAGLYHFQVIVAWGKPVTTTPVRALIELRLNNQGLVGCTEATLIPPSAATDITTGFSRTFKLTAGSSISFNTELIAVGGGSYTFDVNGSFVRPTTVISGEKVD